MIFWPTSTDDGTLNREHPIGLLAAIAYPDADKGTLEGTYAELHQHFLKIS